MLTHKSAVLQSKAAFLQSTHDVVDGVHVVGIPAYEDADVDPHTQVFFEDFHGGVQEGCYYALPVLVWAEEEEGKSVEEIWKGRARPDLFPM
jgi:hypothetical protein